MRQVVRRALMVAGGATLAFGIMAPGAAHAAVGTASTSYGYASFNSSTRVLRVTDTYGDSRRVTAWVLASAGRVVVSTTDANGANNGTVSTTARAGSYASGELLELKVCRQNGSGGTPTDCGYAYLEG
ncbi:hypothetical protein [Plantactinospora soyae]|uniref:Secreted protein n=1 Tax=Plantactinospora soyae TaxID=1544732 RepID=A0A927MEH2_9ACTN|nr:hypothetical protein [Plantactinospora soyae]MBE1489625.1 hypothetical protein [Plantactinospora soyae]